MPTLRQRFQSAAQAFLGREERSIAPFDVTWTGGYGMPAPWKAQQSLQAYGDNTWLYRSVFTTAVQIAKIDFKLRIVKENGDIEKVTNHQALETLRLPQPIKGGKSMLSGFELKFILAMHLMLNGENFWHLDRRLKMGGSPTFIRPLLAQNMRMRFAPDGDLIEYVYNIGSQEQRFDPMDIAHFKFPGAENYLRGHPPVKSIRYALDTHLKADEMNRSKLDNYGAPSGVLKTAAPVPEPERKKILGEWVSKYTGAKNAGKTALLPYGLDWVKTQESNQEMEYSEGKKLVRDEILANYGIGPEILGRTESQTRANAEAAIFVYREFGVDPIAQKIRDGLDNDYMPAFPNPKGAEWYYDNIVPENMEDKRANADNLANGGALTPNERRKMFGLEPLDLPGMDVPYLPISLQEVGYEPPEPDPDPLEVTNTNA